MSLDIKQFNNTKQTRELGSKGRTAEQVCCVIVPLSKDKLLNNNFQRDFKVELKSLNLRAMLKVKTVGGEKEH